MVFIDSPQDLSESERQTLWDRLRQFNQQQGMPFLTYRLQHRFELTTNTLMLKELTQQYPTYSLTAFPAEKLTIPFCIGWGSAGNDQSRLRALKQSPSTGTTSTYIILEVHIPLGDQYGGSTHRNAHIEGQIARMAAHHLHHRAALVRLHGVPQLVDALDGSVAGSVKADGVVGAADVVVDGGRDPYHRDAHPGQLQRAPEGAVAADGHDAIQTQQLHCGR